MRLRPELCRSAFFVYLELRNVSGGCKCSSPSPKEANSAPPNPLDGFEGTLRGGGKRGERGRKAQGSEKKRKERDGTGWEINKFLVTAFER